MTVAEGWGLPVAGYRPQSEHRVQVVNSNKRIEERVLRLLDSLEDDSIADPRWLAIGRAHIEQGFMAINRSIFQPTRVDLAD